MLKLTGDPMEVSSDKGASRRGNDNRERHDKRTTRNEATRSQRRIEEASRPGPAECRATGRKKTKRAAETRMEAMMRTLISEMVKDMMRMLMGMLGKSLCRAWPSTGKKRTWTRRRPKKRRPKKKGRSDQHAPVKKEDARKKPEEVREPIERTERDERQRKRG